MVARTRGWIKLQDCKPNEETFELPPYGVEVRQTVADDEEGAVIPHRASLPQRALCARF
jgi:hypothetical protein